jgi:hypothetical protein
MNMPTISSKDFLAGNYGDSRPRFSKHKYRAYLQAHTGIKVEDEGGNEVTVEYASTHDMRTCYAHIPGIGFIGGWTYPHKKMPFFHLVEKINDGILYKDSNDLPKRRGKEVQ